MDIEIRGLDEAIRKFGRAATEDLLEAPMQRAVAHVQNRMADYPTPPTDSTYRRTGTLGRRWTVRVSRVPGGVEGRVGNNTVYGPFVQSQRFQARIHRGRWQTDEQVIDEERGVIEGFFQRAVDDALNR